MLYRVLKPFLFSIDAETIHSYTSERLKALERSKALYDLALRRCGVRDDRLEVQAFGIRYANPVGLAPGFDKNASLVRSIPALGFGHIEIGSVSAMPWEGNPKPRLFRLTKDKALINRMGLNNIGADAVKERLLEGRCPVPLGINIVKTPDPAIMGDAAIEDFARCYATLQHYASHVTLNISCPNTAEGRTFEDPGALASLLQAITVERRKRVEHKERPLLVKLSPDLGDEQLADIISVCKRYDVAGFVCANTTLKRDGLRTDAKRVDAIGKGGLSGKPLRRQALHSLKTVYRLTRGKMPLIGVGGIFTAEDAYERIKAGASLVQLYTGFVYGGPYTVRRVNEGLLKLMEKDGIDSVEKAIGAGAR
jgi:dihydroorotate dehydrogenase